MKNAVRKSFITLAVTVLVFSLGAAAWASGKKVTWADQKINDNPKKIQFAVIGDRTGQERPGVFKQAMQKLNLMKPDFVVCVGDVIQGQTQDVNVMTKQWDEFDTLKSKLSVPFFLASGNHDIANKAMSKFYQQRYGNPYYHIIYKDILFLFINTNDPSAEISDDVPQEVKDKLSQDYKTMKRRIKKEGHTPEVMEFIDKVEKEQRKYNGAKMTDAQGDYFEKVLKDHKDVRWTFVVMHNRIWQQENKPAAWLRLERLLADRPYTVFGGHLHFHEQVVIKGKSYIGMGTVGGGWNWPLTKPGVYDHILWVTVEDGQPSIANLILGGIRDNTDIRPPVEEKAVTPIKAK